MERSSTTLLLYVSAAIVLLLSFAACDDATTPSSDECDDEADCDTDPSSGDQEDDDDSSGDDNDDDEPRDAGAKRDAGGTANLDGGKDAGSNKLDARTTSSSDGGPSIGPETDAKPSASGKDGGAQPTTQPGQSLPPVTDYEKPGPFETTVVEGQGPNRAYTIFRPRTLGENGFKHSPIIYGCGIATTPSNYTKFLSSIASHGFVVIASNSSGVTDADMMQGLEWILEQNEAAGDYQGKLDVERAVSMGYSIGGTAAVNVGAHASVVTTVSIHGHTTKSALHGPLLQTTGTNDDLGLGLQQGTFDQSEVQTFLATLQNASHFEILGGEELQDILSVLGGDGDGGRETGAIVAWLRYWVYNDEGAKHFFYGDDCVLCKEPWTNPQRKNWPDE